MINLLSMDKMALRVLTFLCFFNFSGIHNGYVGIESVSQSEAPGFIVLVRNTVKAHFFFLNPSKAVRGSSSVLTSLRGTLQSAARRIVLRLTSEAKVCRGLGKKGAGLWAAGPARMGEAIHI